MNVEARDLGSLARRIGAGLILPLLFAVGAVVAVATPSGSGPVSEPWRIVAGGMLVGGVVLSVATARSWGRTLRAWSEVRPVRGVLLNGLLMFAFMTLWFIVVAHGPLQALGQGFGVAAMVSAFQAARVRTKLRLARIDAEFASARSRSVR